MLRTLLFMTLTLGALVGVALLRVWVHQDTVQLGYRLSVTEQDRAKLRETLASVELELAAEHAPAKLASRARLLHMHVPDAAQVVGLSPASMLGKIDGHP